MTGRLHTLIYTDCRPGQGLQGTAGLQFQSCSPGAGREAMAVVQQELLYEPPTPWMRERRPVSEYPFSFAHVWSGCLATARGVYLGREANGAREGNQLTHSVIATSPEAYGLVRPAQMFEAPFWTSDPSPTTACPAVDDNWHPGSFDAEAAQEFVTGFDDGERMLTSLLSALEYLTQPQPRRVLFIAREPGEVARRITAATLLVPQRRALAIGFKIFTTDPAHTTQPILAIHPDWESSSATVDNDQGYLVFDLVDRRWSTVEPTGDARRWVRLFCTEDPYDVVDMVEIAAACGAPRETAPAIALAAVLHQRPSDRIEAEAVVSWLRHGPEELLNTYRAGIANLFVESVHGWPPSVLRDLDAVASAGRLPGQAATIRHALIRAEAAHARRTGGTFPERATAVPASEWSTDDHSRAVETVIATLASATPQGFEAALRVATRFALMLPAERVGQVAAGFIADWADHRHDRYAPAAWPCGEYLRDLLLDELIARAERSQDEATRTAERWWDYLLDELPPVAVDRSPLIQATLATAVARAPDAKRRALVEQCLRELGSGPDLPDRAWTLTAALWRDSPATIEEARLLLRELPRGTQLDQRIFRILDRELHSDRPDPAWLDAGNDLVAAGLLCPSRGVDRQLGRDIALRRLCRELTASQVVDREALRRVLEAVPKPIVAARAGDLVSALTQADYDLVMAALEIFPFLTEPFTAGIVREINTKGMTQTVIVAFYLCHIQSKHEGLAAALTGKVTGRLHEAVDHWMMAAPKELLAEAEARADAIGKDAKRVWHLQYERVAKRRRITKTRKDWRR